VAVIELKADELRRRTDQTHHGWQSTRDVAPLTGLVGQDRAERALEFGVKVQGRGYNVFMAGPTGTGKTTFARSFLRQVAAGQPVPDDICYVYNFSDPDRPRVLELPLGQGELLARDLEALVGEFRAEIPKAFTSEEYDDRRRKATEKLNATMEAAIKALTADAARRGFGLVDSGNGTLSPVPIGPDGKPMAGDVFGRLPEQEQQRLMAGLKELGEGIEDLQRQRRELARSAKVALEAVDAEFARAIVAPRLSDLARSHQGNHRVEDYLAAVEKDILANLADFRGGDDEPQPVPALALAPRPQPNYGRYRVNVVVTHRGASGAPVVYETNPTYYNLFGQITYRSIMGALVTDHTMIKAGAIHRASGGYLIIPAQSLLTSPYAWQALKRALASRQA
jgi:predicted ATP-dependent protease